MIKTVDEPRHNWQMGQLALALALADHPAIALQIADRITNPRQKMYFLTELASKYAAANKPIQVNQVLTKLFQIAATIWDQNQRNLVLSQLIRHQYIFDGGTPNHLWKYDLALKINNVITDPALKGYNFATIAWGYAANAQPVQAKNILAKALESAQAIANDFARRQMLSQLMDEAVQITEYDLARQVANAFVEPSYRVAALRQIAGRYQLSSEPQQANAVLAEAQAVANTIEDQTKRQRFLNAIAQQQSQF